MEQDRFHQLVAGRELGGLDDAEAIELDRHLVGCTRCVAEVRAFDNTMAALALVAPVRHPPQSLQRSIMSAIRAVTPVPRRETRARKQLQWYGQRWSVSPNG